MHERRGGDHRRREPVGELKAGGEHWRACLAALMVLVWVAVTPGPSSAVAGEAALASGDLVAPLPSGDLVAALADTYVFIPQYEVTDTTRTEARGMTIREIIQRCVEGERTKLEGHNDLSYRVTVRVVVNFNKKREIIDEIYAGYEESSGFSRSVRLLTRESRFDRKDGEWVPAKPEEDGPLEVTVSAGDDESAFTSIPFFLEDQQDFLFTLLDRTLEDDRVIFKIGFEPRSDFKPLPSGTVYVDTRAFRIVHEEFRFDGQNPFPMLLGDVRRISRHWMELPEGPWVTARVLADIELKGGWTGLIPKNVAVAVEIHDYVLDAGYDARIFGERDQ